MTLKLVAFGSLVLFLIILLLQSVQAGAAMNEKQMQQMMKQAEEMQKCFGNIDQSVFKALETKGKKMEAEIRALCKAEKRGKAKSAAMKYGKEIAKSKELQAMKKCGAMAQQMMAKMPMMSPENFDQSGHICDHM